MRKLNRKQVEKLISWSYLCSIYGRKPGAIRANEIPSKYKEEIEDLIDLIMRWSEGEKFLNEREIQEKIEGIDIKRILMGEFFISD